MELWLVRIKGKKSFKSRLVQTNPEVSELYFWLVKIH